MAVEPRGVWGKAIEATGLGALNTGGRAVVTSVSCASVRRRRASPVPLLSCQTGVRGCEADGVWAGRSRCPAWRPWTRAGTPRSTRCACASAGSCAAGRKCFNSSRAQGFAWPTSGTGLGPGGRGARPGRLNERGRRRGRRGVVRLPEGSCAAVGDYSDSHVAHTQGFVAVERTAAGARRSRCPAWAPEHGRGRRGQLGVGRRRAAARPRATPTARPAFKRGFAAVERDGAWGRRSRCPAWAPWTPAGTPVVKSVSCPSAGNCAAAGAYDDRPDSTQGFVVSETNGIVWRRRSRCPAWRT